MNYTLTVSPSPAILGEPVTLTLYATAEADEVQALTLDHKSLVIELSRPGWTREGKVALPNRRMILEKGALIREGSPGGIEDLKAGDTRTRVFSLDQLFPLDILNAGEFLLSFRLANQFGEFRAEAEHLWILSGPEAVVSLFHVLAEDEPARRERAATLLHRMTLHGMDYDAFAGEDARTTAVGNWKQWWHSTGDGLPWNFAADGATFTGPPGEPPASLLSSRVGGIAFDKTPWNDSDKQAVLQALKEWGNNPAPASLQGAERVADTLIAYPAEGAVFESDQDIGRALAAAITLLADLIRRGEDHQAEGHVLLTTAAAVPSEIFAGPLTRLANSLPQTPESAPLRLQCAALRHILIPDPEDGG